MSIGNLVDIGNNVKKFNRNNLLLDARVCFNPDCYEKEKDGITFQKCSLQFIALEIARRRTTGTRRVIKTYMKEGFELPGRSKQSPRKA